ncbi:MAG: hypothetical protein H7061_10820 [Bdellovibrionaceae bacterium]|nr:hypothetical protein [Bdellovibrio sp.]
MNIIVQSLILLVLMLSSASSLAKSFSQCISGANTLHRLEREDTLLACFQSHKNFLGSDECFNQISKLKVAQRSGILSEKLKGICFYEASIFQNDKLCLKRADEFQNGENHDEAVFDCYKQFQDKLSQKACVEISNKLIYPAKRNHLYQHCMNN